MFTDQYQSSVSPGNFSAMPPFEPALPEDLSDENLARLLAADARSASLKYSTQGLSALLGGRSSPKAKPNTRFLKNLVKNADTHNDRLKRKEDAERREKLRKLHLQDEERERSERRETRSGEDVRERKKRKLSEVDPEDRQRSSKHRDRGSQKDTRHRRRQRRNTSSGSSRSPSPSTLTTRNRVQDRRHDSHGRHRSQREHTASDSDNGYKKHRSHRKHTRRRDSNLSKVPKSGALEKDTPKRGSLESQEADVASDDPLDSFVNIKPVSQPRSRMDAHFSADYDPTKDTNPNSEDDSDWDRALNAMRDRANFQRAQASRLLAAGFSDEQVKQWKTQPSRPNEGESKETSDLKWKAKGEEREWDKGKPLLGEHVVFSDSENEAKNEEKASPKRPEKKTRAESGWNKSGGLLKGFKSALGS